MTSRKPEREKVLETKTGSVLKAPVPLIPTGKEWSIATQKEYLKCREEEGLWWFLVVQSTVDHFSLRKDLLLHQVNPLLYTIEPTFLCPWSPRFFFSHPLSSWSNICGRIPLVLLLGDRVDFISQNWYCCSTLLLLFSRSVMSDSWHLHGLQHARLSDLHYLPELSQTHVHWISDAIQPSHPPPPSSPPALNLAQHQSLFPWVTFSHQVAKGLELQLQHLSFQWIFRVDFL